MSKSTLYKAIGVTVTLVVVGIFFILGVPFDLSTFNFGNQAAVSQTGGQLMAQDAAVGTGAAVKAGDTVTINYTGRFQDGTVFDTSVGKAPVTFTVGSGEIIPGVEQGMIGMQQGGKRLLVIPPSLAYGAQDYGPIPGNSTLVFDIELVSIAPTAQ